MIKTSALQQAIETVESLPPDEQEILLSLLQKRQKEQRRVNLLQETKEIRQEYTQGNVQFGSLNQFLNQRYEPRGKPRLVFRPKGRGMYPKRFIQLDKS